MWCASSTARLLLQKLLEACEHHSPILFGMLTLFFSRVLVLRKPQHGVCPVGGHLNRDGMVVFWHVCLPRKWTKMTVLKHVLRLQFQNDPLILIGLSFPLALPNDGTSFFPIRDSVCAE